jgi:molybdopterin-guanine dinucleotide biosynthesis protein A
MQMIEIPNMVLIGASGRNVGKTTLACALISQLRRQFTVIGVKVTTVDTKDGPCPRGGRGCGTCASLQGDYEIIEESQNAGHKDTHLMHKAQAAQVYWIKSLRSHLREAVQALLERVGKDCVLVCESTGLRAHVEPGLFLLTDSESVTDPRPSARQLRHLADRVLHFDGQEFDACVDRFRFDGTQWHYPAQASCVILAGGASRRMGQDKSMLPVQGTSLIRHIFQQVEAHFDEVIISSNTPEAHQFPGVKLVSDPEKGRGPLMGIYTALQASSHSVNFVIACDIPLVDTHLARHLIKLAQGYDAVIPRSGPGFFEPLFAVYKRSLLGDMEKTLAQGRNRILDALETSEVLYVDLSDLQARALMNLNTKDDYQSFIEMLEKRRAR